ncbi:MAG: HEAT repeat domain-containing protein [Candidatus Solibacter usitatus]|nr:HEAT repeat domain-containing protein [Candidatus Solibacter usitatus]
MRLLLIPLVSLQLAAADADVKSRVRTVRNFAKQGVDAVSNIAPYLEDRDRSVRWEAVKALAFLGGPRSMDPLLMASHDTDERIQARAIIGVVNFYLPGYLKSALRSSGRLGSDTSDIIEQHVVVREDVIRAFGRLAGGSGGATGRAHAARALGILRGQAALHDLYTALRSKNDALLFESILAVQKIRQIESGPEVQFLLRDLKESVQIAAVETTGVLQNKAALPDLAEVLERTKSTKVRRAALTAIALLPEASNRDLYARYFTDRDEHLRGAAAEGYGRLRQSSDLGALEAAFHSEKKAGAKLSMAFACAMLGNQQTGQGSPLQHLVGTLRSRFYRDSAGPLLVELAQDAQVRQTLASMIPQSKKAEKIGIANVLGETGDGDNLPALEALQRDSDQDAAQAGLRAVRNISARTAAK